MRGTLFGLVTRYLGRLRYPWLFAIAALLFLGDLFIPDLIPFADEILLAVITMLLGARKKRNGAAASTQDGGTDNAPPG